MKEAELIRCAAGRHTRGAPKPGSQRKLDGWAGLEIGVNLDTFTFFLNPKKIYKLALFSEQSRNPTTFQYVQFLSLSAFFFFLSAQEHRYF